MKKSDLKNGMILETNNNTRGIVLDDDLVNLKGKKLMSLSILDDNFMYEGYLQKIVKVYDSEFNLLWEKGVDLNDIIKLLKKDCMEKQDHEECRKSKTCAECRAKAILSVYKLEKKENC